MNTAMKITPYTVLSHPDCALNTVGLKSKNSTLRVLNNETHSSSSALRMGFSCRSTMRDSHQPDWNAIRAVSQIKPLIYFSLRLTKAVHFHTGFDRTTRSDQNTWSPAWPEGPLAVRAARSHHLAMINSRGLLLTNWHLRHHRNQRVHLETGEQVQKKRLTTNIGPTLQSGEYKHDISTLKWVYEHTENSSCPA